MFKSYRVGALFNIPIKLDITLLLVLPIFAWLIGSQIGEVVPILNQLLNTGIEPASLQTGTTPLLLGFIAAIGLFIGVIFHELGHSLTAIRYGYHIDSITLWLLGGIANLTDQPRTWHHEFWIAIAGPIVSIAVGVLCYAIIQVIPPTQHAAIFVIGYLAFLNVALAIFNMLPAFPLDGGRVLRSLLTRTRPFAQATQQSVQIGKFFAIVLGLFGLLTLQLFLIAVAFFIYMAGAAEGRQTLIASIFEDVPVNEVMTPANDIVTVPATLDLDDLLERMMDHRHSGYPVIENDELVGLVTIDDLRQIPSSERATTTVQDVMSTDLKTIHATSNAMDAFLTIAQHNIGRLIVTNDHGDFVGLVTRTDLVRAFDIIKEHKLVGESPKPSPLTR